MRVDASSLPIDELEIGVRGEFAAEIIETRGLRPGFDDRRHPNLDGQSLLKYQIEMWLGEITRPLQINAEHHKGADAYALSFQAPEGEWVRAPNMGFGVSYALPIVVAGLTAATGGLMIVENPEASSPSRRPVTDGCLLSPGWLPRVYKSLSKRTRITSQWHASRDRRACILEAGQGPWCISSIMRRLSTCKSLLHGTR